MSVSDLREFAAILYEHVDFDVECSRCGECCKNIPFLIAPEKTSIATTHGEEVLNGNSLIKKETGYCVFHSQIDGLSVCGLHGSCKPTSCQAFFCKKLLQSKYGLGDEHYYQFIAYWRRTLRMELYGEDGFGYD